MSPVSCQIIRDMLPLYYDNVCSSDTREMVDEHLKECKSCQAILDNMKLELHLPEQTIDKNMSDINALKQLEGAWRKTKAASFIKGLVIAISICSLLGLGYIGLSQWNIVNVPTNVAKISDVGRLKDGRLVYHVKMTDGYQVNQVSNKLDSDGNYYMTPVRPVMKTKKFAEISLANSYFAVHIDGDAAIRTEDGKPIQAVYLGTPRDRVLIWKRGTPLPPASEAAEAQN